MKVITKENPVLLSRTGSGSKQKIMRQRLRVHCELENELLTGNRFRKFDLHTDPKQNE